MVSRITTVSFVGVEACAVDVQVQTSPGLPSFSIVGLPNKAVSESRDRIRASFHSLGLSLPVQRIVVNLAPADLPKEGSHCDLPIALALLVQMGVIEQNAISPFVAIGELALDGRLMKTFGALIASMLALERGQGLVCPEENMPEASWSGLVRSKYGIVGAQDLLQIINHFKGIQMIDCDLPPLHVEEKKNNLNMRDVRGQENVKRAFEIAAAGGHHLLMVGPPGSGKSMMAERFTGILPLLESRDMLASAMIYSVAGLFKGDTLFKTPPFRSPHHSASMASLVGGGQRAQPGEVSLAHNGVLFLDELPEFSAQALDALRQPIETGHITIARAQAHITYPSRFQLIAAMNPCRCGFAFDPSRACARVPQCAFEYQRKLSGPLLDRFDLAIRVQGVDLKSLRDAREGESSQTIALRVQKAQEFQKARYLSFKGKEGDDDVNSEKPLNARVDLKSIEEASKLTSEARSFLYRAGDQTNLTARGYHRVLRVARTIADLEGKTVMDNAHVSEALSYRNIDSL